MLFIDRDQNLWGSYDEDTGAMRLHKKQRADSLDLLDVAATSAYRQGAKVFQVETGAMPGGPGTIVNAVYKS